MKCRRERSAKISYTVLFLPENCPSWSTSPYSQAPPCNSFQQTPSVDVLKLFSSILLNKPKSWTQHNDTQHNDPQHNDTQHNDTQHNDTEHNDRLSFLLCHKIGLHAECH
jgi:hypothetical protein